MSENINKDTYKLEFKVETGDFECENYKSQFDFFRKALSYNLSFYSYSDEVVFPYFIFDKGGVSLCGLFNYNKGFFDDSFYNVGDIDRLTSDSSNNFHSPDNCPLKLYFCFGSHSGLNLNDNEVELSVDVGEVETVFILRVNSRNQPGLHFKSFFKSYLKFCGLNTSSFFKEVDSTLSSVINGEDTGCSFKNIAECFSDVVDKYGSCTALIYNGKALSYKELDNYSNLLADNIDLFNLDNNSIVALDIPKSFEEIIAMLAILKSGNAYLPLDSKMPVERLKYILDDAGVELILTKKDSQLRNEFGIKYIDLDNLLCTDGSFEYSIDSEQSPCSPSYINYTSGTSGKPKAVVVNQSGVLGLTQNQNYLNIKGKVKTLHIAPYSFDAATFEIWYPILNGGVCVIYDKQRIYEKRVYELVSEHSVNSMFFTATMFNFLVDQGSEILNKLDHVLFGGEEASLYHVKRATLKFVDTKITNIYGPTECTTFSSHFLISEFDKSWKKIPIGKAIKDTDLYILDKDFNVVPKGVIGEIYIGGNRVANGYLNNLKKSNESFFNILDERRVYRTGDLGLIDFSGNLIFLGRKDDQIKLRGFRIEKGEIENAINSLEKVDSSHITVEGDNYENRLLAAYVKPNNKLSAGEIKSKISELLPHYMIPDKINIVDFFPVNKNGKLDIKKLSMLGDN
ncbi:amino acid adenylation domain-containing protein [Pseudoalteromonas sp. CO348]|uniref:amino acid adenylation domain-containing protein n=1 Tax=Pseudoalteromonas sp. CO348 TaxID=1777271 RepID=UPI0013EEDA34|nr:amino acid adenylation domain-containing protein [Pseudoalteromonas sp. CO348]